MKRALAETLHCLNTAENLAGNGMDMNVLVERQRALMKWQLQDQLQQQRRYLDGNEFSDMGLSEFVTRSVKDDPGPDNGWPDFGQFGGEGCSGIIGSSEFGIGSGFEMNYGLSRTTSCPPAAAIADVAVAETEQRESVLPEKMISKKRKVEKNQNLKAIAEDDSKQKRVKGCPEEGESKITEQSSNKDSKNTSNKNSSKRETSADTLKENSKVTEDEKPDYIHVRARRGQATDSHSLAERVRREKISERMKYLQDLVPGCNKITGKAGMLDEIINYVQSLQRQVEFLSMKLAAANPALDFNFDYCFAKEVFPSNFPIGVSSEITNPSHLQFNPIQKHLQFNPIQKLVSCNGLEMGLTAPEIALRRTISAPVSIPETFLDSSCFNHIQSSSAWDANLQSLYSVEFLQGRSTTFQSQQFTGSNEASNLKMEM